MKNTKTIRGYTFYSPSERDLLQIFPEAVEIIQMKILEQEAEYAEQLADIEQLLTTVQEEVPKEWHWFYDILTEKLYIPNLLKVESDIFRLKRLLTIAKGKVQSSRSYGNFEEKKATAKHFPIYELARNRLELKPSGKNFIGLCPLHQEKSPSFYLYTDTNSFYCFGCNEGGDVITLTMRLYGIGFADAVEMLQ